MTDQPVLLERAGAVASLTLNRPQVQNAFDDSLIAVLDGHLQAIAADPDIRAVVVQANGDNFSSGGDLAWMRRSADQDAATNRDEAGRLAGMYARLYRLPQPTVALVQGAAVGGGVGLAACCDVVIAADTAKFRFSEVRIGLIPALVGPYVVQAIGARAARRYLVTAAWFSAAEAERLGLVHRVVPQRDLAAACEDVVADFLKGGPAAQAAGKDLVAFLARRGIDDTVVAETAERIARLRASPEGREGLDAFLAKRKPAWSR
ncbi:MAG: enoyl-CoA hydratase/isomerase family protein [Alphaproteobacteria bacterium]|nr:enoyl-CoA hydratase/isomerase family protein [Alphaproteobacteria bacterium]